MKPRYLRIDALATTPGKNGEPAKEGRYPVSKATIWRWVREGHMPAPEALGAKTSAWRVDRLDLWDADRAAAQKVGG